MMVAGLMGMPRRVQTYPDDFGWELWNGLATLGAFTIALGVLVFIINFIMSIKKGEESGSDPWDARTLEWDIPSPPPPYNFKEIPHVHALDDFWHQKYAEDRDGKPVPIPAGAAAVATGGGGDHGAADAHDDGHGIHLPSPSFMPLIAAIAFPIIGLGLVYVDNLWMRPLIAVGALILLVGIYGWALEPATEEE
jgi:cytochrome c oxidase subunit 1